jgi:hypothetical protein
MTRSKWSISSPWIQRTKKRAQDTRRHIAKVTDYEREAR